MGEEVLTHQFHFLVMQLNRRNKTRILRSRGEHIVNRDCDIRPWWHVGQWISRCYYCAPEWTCAGVCCPRCGNYWEDVCQRLNAKLRGWQNYFQYGTVSKAYGIANRYVEGRVRHFLRRRHKRTNSRCTRQFPTEKIFGALGVHRMRRAH